MSGTGDESVQTWCLLDDSSPAPFHRGSACNSVLRSGASKSIFAVWRLITNRQHSAAVLRKSAPCASCPLAFTMPSLFPAIVSTQNNNKNHSYGWVTVINNNKTVNAMHADEQVCKPVASRGRTHIL